MTQSIEHTIFELLIAQGHLTQESIERIEVEIEGTDTFVGCDPETKQRALLDTAVRLGLVAPEVVAELALGASHVQDIETGAPVRFPVAGLERFDCLELLGQGGMGQVFKAFDNKIGRFVAIKFIRATDSKLQRRFAIEARAQARVSHPNICEVHDVGEADGRQYIVMQFIDGKSLKEMAKDLTLERRVRVIRDVAAAVHSAHRTGLIHRDLKPGNVMVASDDDGLPIPYVVDFGIARDLEDSGMTETGDLLGSPAFMAPEQARGDAEVDRRADVYGLGATLYAALTGNPPLTGPTAFDTLMRVQLDEPVPPRKVNPAIPTDLESVVLKALEKEPGRRYQSAQHLADDLDRFLDGKPVVARPAGAGRRFAKWVRRHPTLSASVAVLTMSVVIAVVFGLRASAEAREWQRLTMLFGTEAERLDATMRVAYLLPLHDTTPDRDRIRARMRWIRGIQEDVEGRAKAPGWYALGRGHLVLGEDEQARNLLGDAWDAGYRSPDVAYAYGLALGRLYWHASARLDQIRDPGLRQQRQLQIQSELRDPAVEMLRMANDVEGVAPAYVQGLLEMYEGENQRAGDLAREAIADAPFNYEAWLLQGEAALSRAGTSLNRGDTDSAQTAFSVAEESFTEVTRLAQSDPRGYSGLCRTWGLVMSMRLYGQGGDIETPFENAVISCDRALIADPLRTIDLHTKAMSYRIMAENAIRQGEDPRSFLELSRTVNRKLAELVPHDDGPQVNLGDTYSVALMWLGTLDNASQVIPMETALEWSRLGIEHYRSAVEIAPNSLSGYQGLGTALWFQADLEIEAGLDPSDSFRALESAYHHALELDPTSVSATNNHASILFERGRFELRNGIDPRPTLEDSIQTAGKALELKPNHITALLSLAQSHTERARYLNFQGDDPSADLDTAQVVCTMMAETNPEFRFRVFGETAIFAERAWFVHHSGGDAAESIASGLAAAEQAYELVTARKEIRWDYATLLMLAAEQEDSPVRRQQLASRAVSLFEEIAPPNRYSDWEERLDRARKLALD